MKFFKSNSTQTRFDTHEGQQYLVVPVVMARAGVEMNGAVIQESDLHAASWNGVPVTVTHPKDSNGNDISANSPDVLEKYKVGQIFNAKVEDGKLKAEAWVHVDKAGEELIDRLQSMDAMDVSTGYFSVIHNGEYKDIKPDHLALLPNEKGACSFDDGCGVRSNFMNKLMTNIRKVFGSGLTDELKLRMNERGFLEIAESLHSVLNDMNYGNTYHYVVDVFEEDFIYAVDKDGDVNYFRRSYSVNDGQVSLGENKQEVQKEVNYKPKTNGVNMIDELIANDASPFTEADKESLEAMSDETIQSLSEKFKAEPKNNKKEEKQEQPESVLSNDDKEALELARQARKEKREEFITHITANSQMCKDNLEKMDTNTLKQIASGIKPAADYSGRSFGTQTDKDEDIVKAMTTPSTAEIIQNKRKVN